MSTEDYTLISSKSLSELPYLPAHIVLEWLEHQSDFMGEAVAKACYQQITNSQSMLETGEK